MVTTTPNENYRIALREILVERFSGQELRALCFDLNVDYEDLPGEGKTDKALALIAYSERHDRLAELVRVGKKQRPAIAWPGEVFTQEDTAPVLPRSSPQWGRRLALGAVAISLLVAHALISSIRKVREWFAGLPRGVVLSLGVLVGVSLTLVALRLVPPFRGALSPHPTSITGSIASSAPTPTRSASPEPTPTPALTNTQAPEITIPSSDTPIPETFTPTRRPTPSPSITVSPTKTRTPSYAPSPSRTEQPKEVVPQKAPNIGKLMVSVPKGGCEGIAFTVRQGVVTLSGTAGVEMRLLASGEYEVIIKSGFGSEPSQQGVVITADKQTLVDFSGSLGTLRINGYPEIGAPSYDLTPSPHGNLNSGVDVCGASGDYKVSFASSYKSCSTFYCSPFANCCTTYTVALFPSPVVFDVQVKAGDTTTVRPEGWPYQLGLLLLKPSGSVGKADIEDVQGGRRFSSDLDSPQGRYWMIAGRYSLTLLDQPYTGTLYEFEIRSGQETPLRLPGSP